MYADFLRMDLPAGMSVIAFAHAALVVCAAEDVGILELRINEIVEGKALAGWQNSGNGP